jgi:shikimate dehydrogenase
MGIPYAEVIGDPIGHSKSPIIHGFWLSKLGLEGEYRRTLVRREELGAFMESRRADPDWRGCNVTIPHKERVAALVDDAEDRDVGAINCVLPAHGGLIGRNTDTAGVEAALQGSPGNRICLIGAGGAARGALAFLERRQTMDVSLIVRDVAKARHLQSHVVSGRVYSFDQCEQALAGAEWVINATPLGMTGQPPMPERVLDALRETEHYALVFDMVYQPLETPLLVRARQLGRRTADGLTMLIGQARPAFEFFFGRPAPREHDAELRELLLR